MEITTEKQDGGWVELRVKGRLDSYWADHFQAALDETIRTGGHKVRLNLAGIGYLSSAGIGAVVRCHKQLEAIRGKLVVVNPSEAVKEVLQVTHLAALLNTLEAPPPGEVMTVAVGRTLHRREVSLELFQRPAAAGLTCRVIGDAGLLDGCRFGPADCQRVQFPPETFGVGLGALGRDFTDCRERFGEFLAAAGAAAYLPTDGTNVPDYLVAASASVAELEVCYAVQCAGEPAHFTRFTADQEVGRVSLPVLVSECLNLAEADRIGLVLLGETAGLMGAALRRSPAGEPISGAPFAFPAVREWLSYTAERAHPHALALVVGVAGRGDPGPLAPLVRPLGKEAEPWGHCHAAAFSYRPLPRGELDLRPTLAALFEQQRLQGVLHLLADPRAAAGLGESLFVRGACWFGPVASVTVNGGPR